jgi:riboflavin synthase
VFTGLVEAVGRIERVEAALKGRRIEISAGLLDEELPLGASLAVDGVCLTVVAWHKGRVALDVGPETIQRTTLGELQAGAAVNLERPLRMGDRLGGHLVAGHVDAVGRIERLTARGEAVDVFVTTESALLRYVVEKGSIAVDGISLTVNQVDGRGFSVSIIPHTQTATTLTQKKAGASVNLEVDLIGKYVEKLVAPHLEQARGQSLLETLKENGYVDE